MIGPELAGVSNSAGIDSSRPMISLQSHRIDFQDRIDSATRLIDATHPPSSPAGVGVTASPISREARGLAIVLLFAA